MRKDYARKMSPSKKIRQKKSNDFASGHLWICGLICCVLGLFGWGYYTLHKNKKSAADIFVALFSHHHHAIPPKETPVIAQKNTVATNEITFDFYDALPNDQSTLPVTPAAPMPVNPVSVISNPPLPPTAPVVPLLSSSPGYFLIFGEFPSRSEAARARLSLLLSGIDSKMLKINHDGRFVWRIQKGPFPNQKTAHTELARIKRKGIEGYIDKIETIPT